MAIKTTVVPKSNVARPVTGAIVRGGAGVLGVVNNIRQHIGNGLFGGVRRAPVGNPPTARPVYRVGK